MTDVSFSLEPGLVLGVIGVNGSGKTTLLRSILGSYRLDKAPEDQGELWIGEDHFRENEKAYKESMAYVLQDNPYSEFMHPVEIGERYGRYYPGFDLGKYKELLNKYEVPVKKMITQLSKGQVLRMQMAFALSYPAKLYVFDEPVGNLDVEFRDSFYDVVRELIASEESAVILSSHLVTELERVADKLLWIGRENGKGFVRFFGTLDELKENYWLLSTEENLEEVMPEGMICGRKLSESHREYLLRGKREEIQDLLPVAVTGGLRCPDLQEITYYVEKESAK